MNNISISVNLRESSTVVLTRSMIINPPIEVTTVTILGLVVFLGISRYFLRLISSNGGNHELEVQVQPDGTYPSIISSLFNSYLPGTYTDLYLSIESTTSFIYSIIISTSTLFTQVQEYLCIPCTTFERNWHWVSNVVLGVGDSLTCNLRLVFLNTFRRSSPDVEQGVVPGVSRFG